MNANDVVLQFHESRHDERYDEGCPICQIASEMAAKAWDTTGTDEYAIKVYRASDPEAVVLTESEARLQDGNR